MIGETVGNYKIVSKLSIGGMGTVYKAEHALIGKHAAVKILHPELSSNRDIVNRFFMEAKGTTTIKHPGIVEIFDYGYMQSGAAYLTMEFLEGMSLARRLKMRGPMGEGEAAMLLRGVCSALAAAHAKGIIHRDLKPDNIFLTPDSDSAIGERPKLLDFGIAKLTDIGLAGTATKTGAVMGTPTYMSPEQCRGTGDVDARADLYSIGCIFYELVTGRPPFTNLGAGELIGAHLYLDPEPPVGPHLHPETVKLIMALLRKRPAERPQTAKELGLRLADLAQKLGWITASSPSGVTGPMLTDIALRAQTALTAVDRPALPSMPSAHSFATDRTTPLFTPGGSSAPSLASLERSLDAAEMPVDKPTTLSGAASQIDLPKRSRKGLGIAMAAAALLAGGAVAFFKLNQRDSATPAPAKAPIVVEEVKKEPPPPPPPPPSPAAPVEAKIVEPPKDIAPEPVAQEVVKEDSAADDKLADERKRQQQRRRTAVKPPKKDEPSKIEPKKIELKKIEPPKPKPNPTPLIERDIE